MDWIEPGRGPHVQSQFSLRAITRVSQQAQAVTLHNAFEEHLIASEQSEQLADDSAIANLRPLAQSGARGVTRAISEHIRAHGEVEVEAGTIRH